MFIKQLMKGNDHFDNWANTSLHLLLLKISMVMQFWLHKRPHKSLETSYVFRWDNLHVISATLFIVLCEKNAYRASSFQGQQL